MRTLFLALTIVLTSSGLALAACPPAVPGNQAEAILANQNRVICLQREAAQNSIDRSRDVQINALENRVQSLELQERLNRLPPPVPAYTPPVYAPPLLR